MRVGGQLRTILAVIACLALVAVGVVAVQHQSTPQPTAAVGDQTGCTGNCANCPYAESGTCHAGSAADDGPDAAIDEERCIGCARCVNVAPEAFEMNPDSGKAEVVEGAPQEAIERGAAACPVDAISG
jgi:ferredoxin